MLDAKNSTHEKDGFSPQAVLSVTKGTPGTGITADCLSVMYHLAKYIGFLVFYPFIRFWLGLFCLFVCLLNKNLTTKEMKLSAHSFLDPGAPLLNSENGNNHPRDARCVENAPVVPCLSPRSRCEASLGPLFGLEF